MKRLSSLIAIILFTTTILNAQMNTGSKFVAGSNNFSFGASNEKYVGTTSDPYKYFNINLNTKAGYFLKNRIAIGGLIDFGYGKSSQGTTYKNSSTIWSIGPLARYYVEYGKLIPFAEASVNFGMQNSKTEYSATSTIEEKHSVFGIKAGIGADFFLNESIAFEGMLNYYMNRLKPATKGATGEGTLENGFGCSFGIIFYFGTI
jgi:hypothetical protein